MYHKIYIYLFLIQMVLFLSCLSSPKIDTKLIVPSPDNTYVAISFLNNGGSLSGYASFVVLKKVEYYEKINFKENENRVFYAYRNKYIEIFWKDNNTLVILHNCLDEYIFKQLEILDDINIEYIIPTMDIINPQFVQDFEYSEYYRKKYHNGE